MTKDTLYNYKDDEIKKEDLVHVRFMELLRALEKEKPNDRSTKDRFFAIVITEIQKALAVYLTYCKGQ